MPGNKRPREEAETEAPASKRPRRKCRNYKPVETTLNLICSGYSAFEAVQRTNASANEISSDQVCGARLYVSLTTREKSPIENMESEELELSETQEIIFFGTSADSYGHAEMHALHQFVKSKWSDSNLYTVQKMEIECTEKPCCLRCSAILGLLGVTPKNCNTLKIPRSMGKTEWTISGSLRIHLNDRFGFSPNADPYSGFNNYTKLP